MEINRQIIYPLVFIAFLLMNMGLGAGAAAPDVNQGLVGHFGGTISIVDVAGNYAYVGQGQDLLILDITTSSAPVSLGKITTKGFVNDIKVSGNYAYVAEIGSFNGLVIVDISNPSSPVLKGNYGTNG